MMKGESACDDYLDVFTSVLLPALEDPKTKGRGFTTQFCCVALLSVRRCSNRPCLDGSIASAAQCRPGCWRGSL